MGAGSSELLCLAGMSVGLEGGAVLSAFRCSDFLMDYAAKFNARWDTVNLDEYLVHDLNGLASAVKSDTKIIFLVNLNNPTGTVVTKQVQELLRRDVEEKRLFIPMRLISNSSIHLSSNR